MVDVHDLCNTRVKHLGAYFRLYLHSEDELICEAR
jgi:hypothetical protein